MAAPQLTLSVQGTTQVSADQLNTYEQTCDTVPQLRGFNGTSGMQVFVRGFATPIDGGQGIFSWELVTNPVDDGVNTIVPYGQSSAAWIRIPMVGQIVPVLNFTTGSSITLSTSNYILNVDKTVGSPTSVTLPSDPAFGQVLVVKDGKGDAGTNHITISGGSYLIDNASTYVMNLNNQSISVFFNGTGWGVW